MKERPLVSFCLVTYRQEQYVAQAVKSALAQTYDNLEIIITDDCSPDGTWAIIEKTVAEYKGPHKIILNHNETNHGVVYQINKVFTLARGDILVTAAGDDYSEPERVAQTVKAFQLEDNVAMVGVDWKNVDPFGNRTSSGKNYGDGWAVKVNSERHRIFTCLPCFKGAVLAYRRDVWDMFGPLSEACWGEDIALSYRACLLGSVYEINEPLVNYRTEGGISTSRSLTLEMAVRVNIGRNECYRQVKRDVLKFCPTDEALLTVIDHRIASNDIFVKALGNIGYTRNILFGIKYFSVSGIGLGRRLSVTALSLLPYYLRGICFKIVRWVKS